MENWQSFSKYKSRNLLFFYVFSIFANVLLLVMPIYSLQIFNRVLSSQSTDTLVYLALIAFILIGAQVIFDYIRQQILNNIMSVYDGVFERTVIRQNLSFDQGENKGGNSYYKDHQLSKQYLSSPINKCIADLPWTACFIIVLFILHPILGLYAFLSTVVLLSINGSVMLFSNKTITTSRNVNAKQALSLQGILGRNKLNKSPLVSHRVIDKWKVRNAYRLNKESEAKKISGKGQSLAKFFRLAVQVGVYAIGAWLVIKGEIMSGSLLASSILLGRILAPIDQGAAHYFSWKEAKSAYHRISKLLQDIEQKENNYIDVSLEQVELSVDKVSVSGEGDRQLLKNINFNLKAGSFLCIDGASGSGKSTLLRLIAGCITPSIGQIKYNGIPKERLLDENLSKSVSYLPQLPEMFESTIADNISGFDQGENVSKKIVEVSKSTSCHEFIAKLPNSYSTQIGNGGVILTPCEAQKISIASCFYSEPKLIILDDPTVYLGENDIDILINNLRHLKNEGCTAVFTTSNEKLKSLSDYIVELNNGSVSKASENKNVKSKEQVVSHLASKSFKY